MPVKELRTRKNIRLRGYDYSRSGCYFVMICVKDRQEMLGKAVSDVGAIINRPCSPVNPPYSQVNLLRTRVELSEYGHITESAIHGIPEHYEGGRCRSICYHAKSYTHDFDAGQWAGRRAIDNRPYTHPRNCIYNHSTIQAAGIQANRVFSMAEIFP